MPQASLQILLVEDSPTDAQLFQHVFSRATTGDWALVHVERLSEAIAACQTQAFDITVLDLGLPDSDGLETIAQFNQTVPEVPIIILTMVDDEELSIQAMAQGAQDYLVKDQVTAQLLRRSIRYTLERSQILQQLRASERATLAALDKERELNQLKSYFVSMVSHEFRNPLNSLQVVSEMLLRFGDSLSTEKKAHYGQLLNATIAHMGQLLDEVILLGQVDTSHFEIEYVAINLAEFCTELIDSIQPGPADSRSITLDFRLAENSLAVDTALLQHILTNLISNALKYSPPDQVVQVEVDSWQGWVRFCICDRGIGIPPAEQSRLFQTFSRCSNVGQVRGTGLGLAIVKRCVDLYHGDIQVESEVGVGTQVTVLLPLKPG
jgi:signal transduction histidine kinase